MKTANQNPTIDHRPSRTIVNRLWSIFIAFLAIVIGQSSIVIAQTPQAIPYQAVARDASGGLITNQSIGLQFTIVSAPFGGFTLYQETQTVTTNALGLFTANIGQGTVVSGTFSTIDWGSIVEGKLLNVGIDVTGGTNYTDMGTTPMLSVPFALYSGKSSNGLDAGSVAGNTLHWDGTTWLNDGNLFNNGGSIGIGTSSPLARLHVHDNNENVVGLRLTGNMTGTGSFDGLKIGLTGSSPYIMNMEESDLTFGTFGTTRMRITSDGNVGIGAIAPEFKLTLDNDGGILAKGIFGNGPDLTTSGAGARMIWYPKKSAFRAGTVSGSLWNDANIGLYSFASGYDSKASNDFSTAMGHGTTASGMNSFAIGGLTTASNINSTAMGSNSEASGITSTAMGYFTTASGQYATAMGGLSIAAGGSSLAAGSSTHATGFASFAMGQASEATDDYSTAMGFTTTASGPSSTAMGKESVASGVASTAMGYHTHANGFNSTAGGQLSVANGTASTAFGLSCLADGDHSVAMGSSAITSGLSCIALGADVGTYGNASHSVVIGEHIQVEGNNSVALGTYVGTDASTTGAFVLGDNSRNTYLINNEDNSFLSFFDNGYSMLTAQGVGVLLHPGSGAWTSASDRHKKENFRTINTEDILQQVSTLPLSNWNYKAQPSTTRHIGPMAQDFYAAFHLDGESDTTINTLDIDGINMAAIQALKTRTDELKKATDKIETMASELAELKLQVAAIMNMNATEAVPSSPSASVSSAEKK